MRFSIVATFVGLALTACAGPDSGGALPGSMSGSPFALTADSSAGDSTVDSTRLRDSLAAVRANAAKLPTFRTIRGHIVRGTDEFSFRPCGSRQVSMVAPRGATRAQITQRYRFSAPTPLTPIFFELSAVIVDSTVTVADYTYQRVLIVDRVLDATQAPPGCPRPSRGSFIESQ